jgi:hypothetical protein
LNHRHLLPEEIDLLLDGEEGFGVQPLKAHLAQCAGCRAEFEAQREVVLAIEGLPHISPSPMFAHKVMSQVQIFEPWHVTWRDTVRGWFPSTPMGRRLVFGTGGVMAVTMTLLTVWLAQRADAVLFVGNLVAQRSRGAAYEGFRAFLTSLVGADAATAVAANGATGIALALATLVVAVPRTAYGLKSVASVARRRRA